MDITKWLVELGQDQFHQIADWMRSRDYQEDMKMRQHPSVLFQNGEVKDFYSAMDTYIAQYREELLIGRELYRDYAKDHTPEYRQKWQKELQEQSEALSHIADMVEVARSIYRNIVEEACERAAEEMRARQDRTLDEIANAVENGNWERLAL